MMENVTLTRIPKRDGTGVSRQIKTHIDIAPGMTLKMTAANISQTQGCWYYVAITIDQSDNHRSS